MLPPAGALSELIAAFRLGSQKSSQLPERDLFNERLAERVVTHFGESDREALGLVRDAGSKGLFAVRARDSGSALVHFETGLRLLESLSMSHHARALASSFLSAQRAYHLYFLEKYREAIALVEQAFCDDLILESQCGIDILLLHRIQLLNNCMRIEARRDFWEQALKLGSALLHYLEDPGEDVIRVLPPPWNRGWLGHFEALPPDLVAAMHQQIAAEEVQVLGHAQARRVAAGEIGRVLGSLRSGRPTQISRWIDFQLARIDPRSGDYFAAASALLRQGSVPSAPLWHSVAADVTRSLHPGFCLMAAGR